MASILALVAVAAAGLAVLAWPATRALAAARELRAEVRRAEVRRAEVRRAEVRRAGERLGVPE